MTHWLCVVHNFTYHYQSHIIEKNKYHYQSNHPPTHQNLKPERRKVKQSLNSRATLFHVKLWAHRLGNKIRQGHIGHFTPNILYALLPAVALTIFPWVLLIWISHFAVDAARKMLVQMSKSFNYFYMLLILKKSTLSKFFWFVL